MVKLLLSVFVEAIVGVSLAGLLLAVIVPALNHYRPTGAEDTTAAIVIVAVIVVVTAGVLLRPGSAINRWIRR
jgi:hypothetical protein